MRNLKSEREAMQGFQPRWRVQQWFEPMESAQNSQLRLPGGWLALSLGVACYFGILTLSYVGQQDYIVQDDARQHVVWLQQFADPQLFPQDLIANYFRSIAPLGYQALYWLAVQIGIAPLNFAQILPLLLSLITTCYGFQVTLKLFPVPLSAFLATLILNQQLWLNDDLTSATPRAFVYPIFTAFLYYLLHRSLFWCLLTIALQGLFFPQLVLVQMGILTLQLAQGRKNSLSLSLKSSLQRQRIIFWLSGIGVATLVLLPFILSVSEFGRTITAEQMRIMPEYGLGGRTEYFGVHPLQFWLRGDSGLRIPLFPSIILAGFGLPILQQARWQRRFPLIGALTPEAKILSQACLSSLFLYGLAHLLLIQLHFPSRYTYHTFRIILSIAAGIVFTVLLAKGWQELQHRWHHEQELSFRERTALWLTVTLAVVVITVPALPPLFLQFQGWSVGRATPIYQYLAAQPEDILIASLAPEVNNLPALTQRSVLVGREFALPHHPKYYQQIEQRILDILQMQYGSSFQDLTQGIQKYGINFFLVDKAAFQLDYLQQDWLIRSSVQAKTQQIIQQLAQGKPSAMQQLADQCTVVSTETLILIDAGCIIQNSRR